jgi:predicted flap endonuclease-1-like 5' DNA nuclease
MKQRLRQMDLKSNQPANSPLMRIEIRPGQWVKCRADDLKTIRGQFGLMDNDNGQPPMRSGTSPMGSDVPRLGKDKKMIKNDNPLVKIFNRPGQYVKMRLKDAERLGLEYEYEKGRAPAENKIRNPGEDKFHKFDKDIPKDQWEDFTVIQGVGKATDEKLHANDIHTFESLMAADLSFLPSAAQSAIEAWRQELIADR